MAKKLLMYGSSFSADAADAAGYGWQVDIGGHDWSHLITAKNAELDRLEGIYRNLLKNAGAELIEGWARLTGPNSVSVGDRSLTAAHILIATGGTPQIPDVPGLADCAITSNEALDLPAKPRRIVIYGAGYIALEFASIFNGFGVDTHLSFTAVTCRCVDLIRMCAPKSQPHWQDAVSRCMPAPRSTALCRVMMDMPSP